MDILKQLMGSIGGIVALVLGAVAVLLHFKQRSLRRLEISLIEAKNQSEIAAIETALIKASKDSADAKEKYENSLNNSH